MAVSHKVTYSLKPQVVERVAELAAHWGVPKSEVIHRAIDQLMMKKLESPTRETPLEIFRRLQEKDGISPAAAAKFNREIRRSRRASGRKRG